jgi:membrane protein
LLIGFAISLWSARSGTVALMIGLDFAYKQEETRCFLWFQAIAVALTIGAILFGIAALVLIALLPMMVDFLPLDHQWKTALLLVRWPILACLLAIGLSAMYRLAPRRREKWRWLSWGEW